MAPTYSTGPELGTTAPPFELPATDGKTYRLEEHRGKPTAVMFICNHCPYVIAVFDRLIALGKEFADDVHFFAICSNDAERYPADSFEKMKEEAETRGFPFPYLHDETQQVASAYSAVCTPDIFVYDADHRLAYRGRIDDNWKDESAVTRQDLRLALQALVAGEKPSSDQKPSMGCSIKWKQ